DLPALALVAVAGWLLLQTDRRRTLTIFLPAVLLMLVAFMTTNLIATGGWKPFYAYFGTDKYLWTVDGQHSYWLNPQGIDRGGDSTPVYLLHCLVGHHGIFSLSPIFLITLLGLSPRVRQAGSPLLRLAGWTAVLSLVVIGFYPSRTQNYNYGGVSCALRWSLWLVPLWLVALVPPLDAWTDDPPDASAKTPRQLILGISWTLLALSAVSAILPLVHTWRDYPGAPNPFQAPWLYHLMQQWGWIATV
ncbi:MAG: hypothetical protein VB861_10755, partial [Planctomycetaceae bacterium]